MLINSYIHFVTIILLFILRIYAKLKKKTRNAGKNCFKVQVMNENVQNIKNNYSFTHQYTLFSIVLVA